MAQLPRSRRSFILTSHGVAAPRPSGRLARGRHAALAVLAAALALPVLGLLAAAPAGASPSVFANASSITLNNPVDAAADASPYPAQVAVSGLSGSVSSLTVTLADITYPFSQDIDALLVAPDGHSLILIADSGPSGAGAAAASSTLTFSDAGSLPTASTSWGSSATFKPVNFGGPDESFAAPAPSGPLGDPGPSGTGATLGSEFDGTNPNGTWSLYVITTSAGDGTGSIAGGFSLDITTAPATTTVLASSENPSFTGAPGNGVTFTATVTSGGSPVTSGTVAFSDGGTAIPGCAAVSLGPLGTASCSSTFTSEGAHPLLATYGGTASFSPSEGSLTQQVDHHTTVVNGDEYCNAGPITLNNPPVDLADASPYPSHITVSGQADTLSEASVTLSGITYPFSQDIDALLVGPGGESLILIANSGPTTGAGVAASDSTLTLSDGGSEPAQTTPWGSAPTFKPVDFGGFNETFGPPAPAGPYGDPLPNGPGASFASQFGGTNPNGTWSLYVITTAAGDGTGSIAGGWCLTVTASTTALPETPFTPLIPLSGFAILAAGTVLVARRRRASSAAA